MNDINRPYRSEPDSPEPEPQDAAASVAGESPRSGGPSAASGEISSISSPPSPRHLDPSTLATDPMRQQIGAATGAMRALDSPTARSPLDHLESPAARMARGDLDSPTARALRDYADSPIAKMMLEYAESPAAKALRDYAESPAAKALRDHADSPAARTLRAFVDSPAAKILREFADSPTARMLRNLKDSPTVQALRRYANSPIASELVRYRDTTIVLGRTDRWAHQLSSTNAFAGLTGISANIADFDRIRDVATHISSFGTRAVADIGLASGLVDTRLKVAALAGSADLLGFSASTTVAAYERLFGDWYTKPDLPDRFWRDLGYRRGYYADAEVDAGLIYTTPETAVAVTIESGLAGGISDGEASVATFEIGGMSMQIRSANFMLDAFQVVDGFERTLRLLISQKLSTLAGPRWFKQRVDGKLHQKARENRAAAMANGERDEELISYLDLGDLTGVLLRKDNWDEAFGCVFPNRERLSHDLQALVALRRPTMHARNLDGVQLVELMCVIRRLTQFIDGDGDWKRIAESED